MGRVSYIVVLAFVLNNVVAATEKGHDYCPVTAMRRRGIVPSFPCHSYSHIDIGNVYPVA